MKDDKDISVTRAVGRFFGHIWGATTKPVPEDESKSQVIHAQTDEVAGDVADEISTKKVILRRTTIDEIEIQEDS